MSTDVREITWKVGDLAKRTGLTIRTLHHYDEIGLLEPSRRSRSGHRLYAEQDVERLQRILSLRQLGFSLEQIADVLSGRDFPLVGILEQQVEHVRERIEMEKGLCSRLEAVTRLLRATGTVSVDALLELMEMMMNAEKHFTPEQLAYLAKRREELGEDRIESVENEWPVLIGKVKSAMEKGLDPTSPEVVALAKRWMELVREFTGGDAGVTQSLGRLYQQNLDSGNSQMGIDRAMADYIGKAVAGLKK
jgi:DNA-binding transcriptional MerR regulator